MVWLPAGDRISRFLVIPTVRELVLGEHGNLFSKQEKSSSFLFNLLLAVLTGKMNTRGITVSEGKHL